MSAQHTPTAGFIYVRSEHELWTVGTYASGTWAPESDHGSPDAAAARVHYLNGGNPAHDELVAKANAVARTLEMPTFARQSTKNENAGFIDWRDWCALKGEVMALRAVLAKAGAA